MSEAPISDEVALRLGMAAHTLPETSVGELIDILHRVLGDKITKGKLAKLEVKDLQGALLATNAKKPVDVAVLEEALRFLRGETSIIPTPTPAPYQEGDMPRSVRVAVASNEGEQLDGHFGSCLRWLIYQVSPDEIRLIDVRPTLTSDSPLEKNAVRAEQIHDCHVAYMANIGGPAMAKLFKADIHISKHPDVVPAREALVPLQGVLAGTPPPWLAKLIGVPSQFQPS